MWRKWIVLLIVLLICAAFVIPQISADLHYLLLQQPYLLTLNPINGWHTILAGGKPLRFYLLFTAASALFLVWLLIEQSIDYKTKTQKIAPGIVTPRPAGQGQHGTARWMSKREVRKTFTGWTIRKSSSPLKELIEAGKNDRKEIRNAKN